MTRTDTGRRPVVYRAGLPALGLAFLLGGAEALAAGVSVQVQNAGGAALADAVLTLHAAKGRTPTPPPVKTEIEQVDKTFRPALSVVTVGSSVQFPNRDTVRHHVYSFSPAKTFELKLYAGTPAAPVVFDKPGAVALGCNIHDQMSAWVLVVDTPWHARSGADGRAATDVPPGDYVLRLWHPDLPAPGRPLEQAVSVAASGTSLTLKLPVRAATKHAH
jgi:plastocyanin